MYTQFNKMKCHLFCSFHLIEPIAYSLLINCAFLKRKRAVRYWKKNHIFLSWDHFLLFSLKTLYRFMVCFDLFIPSVVLGFYHVQWFCFLNKIHKCFHCSSPVFKSKSSPSVFNYNGFPMISMRQMPFCTHQKLANLIILILFIKCENCYKTFYRVKVF